MRVQTRHAYHRSVLQVIEQIVRTPNDPLGLPELAAFAGFSRHHFNRLFCSTTRESPGEFARRIRLERAAYRLQLSSRSIADLAEEAGYATPESFTGAFRAAYGLAPSRYRRLPRPWTLPAPSGIHWSEARDLGDPPLGCRATVETAAGTPVGYSRGAPALLLTARKDLAVTLLTRPPLRVAAMRHTGAYGDIPRAWERLRQLLPCRPWEKPGSRLLTVYHDDGRLPGRRSALRADIGYTLLPGDAPPEGMRLLVIPGGPYAATEPTSGSEAHGALWDAMNDTYIPKRGARPRNIPGIDEYLSWPLPWDGLQARVLIGLEMDLGEPGE